MMKKIAFILALSCSIFSSAQSFITEEPTVNLFADNGNHYGSENGNGNNGNPDGNNGGTNNGNGGTNNGNGGTNTNNGGTNNGNGQGDLTGSGGTAAPDTPVAPIDDHLPTLLILALGIITIKGKLYRKSL
jgi:hypothetical protein